MSVDCPQPALLADLVLGKLSDPLIDEVVQHASHCPACAQALEGLDGLSDGLITAVRVRPLAPGEEEESEVLELGRLSAQADELCSRFADEYWREGESSSGGVSTFPYTADEEFGVAGGLRVGQYTLLEKLGQGAMGAVYKARHHKLRRIVALKTLPAHRMRDPQAVLRFDREMEAVGKVDHPNVVRATDAGHLNEVHFLVMEYVEGIDLARLVRRLGPIPIADACEIIRQAALALDHAHQRGLIHRDVKPSNLMLNGEGLVKLLDLGLARLLEVDAENAAAGDDQEESESQIIEAIEEPTTAGQIIGTRDFMAPEQALDSHHVDSRVDIYSLGCTLYKLLTGRAPFEHLGRKDRMLVLQAHATHSPPTLLASRPNAPLSVARILDRMLAKRPQDRFATALEVAEAIEPFCRGANLPRLLDVARGDSEDSLDDGPAPMWAEVVANDTVSTATDAARAVPVQKRRRIWAIVAIAAGICVTTAALWGVATIFWSDDRSPVAEAPLPDSERTIRRVANGRDLEEILGAENRTGAVESDDDSSATDSSESTSAAAPPNDSAPKASTDNSNTEDADSAATSGEKERYALRFGGGSQCVRFPGTHELVDLTKPFTLEIWLRGEGMPFGQTLFSTLKESPSSHPASYRPDLSGWLLTVKDNTVGNWPPEYEFSIKLNDGFPLMSGNTVRFRSHPSARSFGPHGRGFERILRGSQWRHIALCYQGGSVAVYQDGRSQHQSGPGLMRLSSAGASGNSLGGDLTLGAGKIGPGHMLGASPMSGLTGEVRALRLSRGVMYKGEFDPPSEFENTADQTLLLLDFSRGQGEKIEDLSGNGWHGEIEGAEWVVAAPESDPESETEDSLEANSLHFGPGYTPFPTHLAPPIP